MRDAWGEVIVMYGDTPVAVQHIRRSADPRRRSFTIGEAHDASFQVQALDLPGPRFTLLQAEAEEGPVLRFTATTRGELWTATTRSTLAQLIADGRTESIGDVHQVALAVGTRARVDHGAVRFQIAAVEPETAKIGRGRPDGPGWFYSGSALVVLGGLLVLAHRVPNVDDAAIFGHESAGAHHVGYLFNPEVERYPDMRERAGDAVRGDARGESSEPTVHDRPPSAAGRSGRRGFAGVVPARGRDHDPERAARSAGILGLMAAGGGPGTHTFGPDDSDAWADLTSPQIGELDGFGGLGSIGTGRGGALHGDGVIGLGNTGLIGKGSGCGAHCTDAEDKKRSAGFGGRGTRVPTVRLARAEAQGALDPDIIRRIVRAHVNELRHCYNQALAREPEAHGRVAVQFVIGGAGKVTSAVVGESDMHGDLDRCVTRAVRRWSFPRPEGGGSVLVRYPFVFTPS